MAETLKDSGTATIASGQGALQRGQPVTVTVVGRKLSCAVTADGAIPDAVLTADGAEGYDVPFVAFRQHFAVAGSAGEAFAVNASLYVNTGRFADTDPGSGTIVGTALEAAPAPVSGENHVVTVKPVIA